MRLAAGGLRLRRHTHQMIPYLLLGATFAFSAAAQPGPFQAYLVSSTMTSGWRRTMPAAFAPLLSDIPIVALVLLLLARIPPLWLDVLRVAGGAFLLYLSVRAVRAFRGYRREIGTAFDIAQAREACATSTAFDIAQASEACATRSSVAPASVPAKEQRRTLLEAVAVNLLNPNPYISWSTVLGPLTIQAWREAPSHAAALVCAFYTTMVAATAVLVLLLASARSLGPRIGRALVGLSAVALACFGAYQLWTGGVSIPALTASREGAARRTTTRPSPRPGSLRSARPR